MSNCGKLLRLAPRGVLLSTAAVLLTACDGDTLEPIDLTIPGSAQIEIISGDKQTGNLHATLPVPLTVRVTARGRPVQGARIIWSPEGTAGRLSPDMLPSLTNEDGTASAQRRLGATSGTYLATATIEGAGTSVTFSSFAQVQGATHMLLFPGDPAVYAGDTVGSPVTRPYRVQLRDQNDRPVSGVNVNWTASGGSLSSPSSISNADGVAQVSHTRGTLAEINVVTASVSGLSGSPITFRTTVTAGRPAAIQALEGDGQVGMPGAELEGYVIKVVDAHGNAAAMVPVSWAVTSGDGSIRAFQGSTNANGEAGAVYTLGAAGNPQTVTVSAGTASLLLTSHAVSALVLLTGGDSSWWCEYYPYCDPATFEPAGVSIARGQTVGWVWNGEAPHDIVFEDHPDQPASTTQKLTGYHVRTFTSPGTYRYRCTIHSSSFTEGMVGNVTVE